MLQISYQLVKCSYGLAAAHLTKKREHCSSVPHRSMTITSFHEGLAQGSGRGSKKSNFFLSSSQNLVFLVQRPVGLGHEVHAVLVVGGALPDQLGVNGAPVRAGHVVVPAVITLPLVL